MFSCSTIPTGENQNPVSLISCFPGRYNGACSTSLDRIFVSRDGVNYFDSGETCHDAGSGTNTLILPLGSYDSATQPLYVKASFYPGFNSFSYPEQMGGDYSFTVNSANPSPEYIFNPASGVAIIGNLGTGFKVVLDPIIPIFFGLLISGSIVFWVLKKLVNFFKR